MPAYDYRCTGCQTRFEVSRPMSSTAEECCPTCGARAKRVFTPVGVAFKGSGFHNTDYRPKHKEDKAPSPDTCPAKSESSPGCASCPAAD